MRRAGTRLAGGLSITVQKFSEVGDELKVHSHPRDYVTHITIVAKGSVVVLGKRDGVILQENDVTYWEVNEPHGFRALEPDTVIYNVRKAQELEQGWPEQEVGKRVPCPCLKATG